jgi:uncharacterized protein (TIGR03437 family)
MGARRLVRVLALVLPLAVITTAANPPWTQQQELTASDGVDGDSFAASVSVSGDTAVIGAPGAINSRGVAYVFVRSGGVWSQQQEVFASDGASNDNFGSSVSVSGDTAMIGARGKNGGAGVAYVFVRSGGVWSQRQELTVSDGVRGDNFGWSVSVSGDAAVIGAYWKAVNSNTAQGAAYVFVRSGGVWSQQQELTASDGAANDHFGTSVSVSGATAVIGSPNKATSPQLLQGAAYVFVLSGGVWGQQQELTASDGAANDQFGQSVSLSGNTALIGAWAKTIDSQAYQGAVYVFVFSGGTWSQQQELTASDGAAYDQFGQSVSVSGDAAVFGATGDSSRLGAAYVFAQSGGLWSQQQKLTASGGAAYGDFGYPVSVSGNTAVIGSSGDFSPGAAYVFATTQPTITGVSVSGGGVNIAQNAWVEIYGANLAPASVGAGGLVWTAADFVSGQMPTQLQDVSVTVNGKPTYVYFISAAQVNVLTPLDSTTGPVAVTVNNGTTTSAAFTANLQPVSPGFLRFGDGIHIAAEHGGGSLLGPASMSVPGATFTPAAPGETISLFGDGFGLPVTALTAGSEYQSGALPSP